MEAIEWGLGDGLFKIDLPLGPVATRRTAVIGNNWAQSNCDTTEVAHGSPSERRSSGVALTNRLPREATYLTAIDQDSALLRVYLGNAWLRLPPGETAMVEVGYESLAGDPLLGASFEHEFESLARRPPPMLSLTSLVVPEAGDGWLTPHVVWGANLSVRIEGLSSASCAATCTSSTTGRCNR